MQKMKLSAFIKLAVIVLALVCAVIVVKNKIEVNSLAERKSELEAKVAADEEKVGELQNRLDTPLDREFIAALAKEKLNLVMPDEVVFYNDLSE